MEQIAINILPKGAKPVCHSSQFDEGRQIRFNLFNDATPYTLSGTETISVLVHKPDGTEVIDSVTNTSDSYVIWDVSTDACELSGVCECELSIVENGILLGSKNFTMKVEEDAYGGRTIEVRTASGRIATFSTNMVDAFKSLKSDINPVQDLHGYSKPWSGGGGKNKLNCTATTQTINGVTFTVNSNGTILVNGTATADARLELGVYVAKAHSSQKLNGLPSSVTTDNIVLGYQGYGVVSLTTRELVINRSADTDWNNFVYITVKEGATANNLTFEPMMRLSTETDASFEPYENICPISGFNALNVTRTGKNLFKKGVSTSANGVTFTVNDDGSISLSGTATNTAFFIAFENMEMPYGTYTLSGGYSALIAIYIRGSSSGANILGSTGSPSSGVINTGVITGLIRIQSGTNTDGITLKPQLEVGNQASTYEPYNGQTATVNFGQTVYGGVADVTNGKVTITHAIIDLGDLTWTYATDINRFYSNEQITIKHPASTSEIPYILCSHYQTLSWDNFQVASNDYCISNPNANGRINIRDTQYTDATTFKTAMSGVQLVYELATPIEITTTPEILTAISGENNVYGDTNGDTTVEYYIEV